MVSMIHSKNQVSLLKCSTPHISWRGIDASLADKWSTGSRPSLFPPLRDRLNLAGPALLLLRRRVQLGVRCGASHLAEQLRLHRPKKKGVRPVDQLGFVLNPQRTDGSSSTQAPAVCLRSRMSRGFSPLRIRPFALSACPFDCG